MTTSRTARDLDGAAEAQREKVLEIEHSLDTLWAGLPAVVLQSRHLAGRAAASFVSAIGTASSVAAPGLRDYENAIAEVGRRGPRLRLRLCPRAPRSWTRNADATGTGGRNFWRRCMRTRGWGTGGRRS